MLNLKKEFLDHTRGKKVLSCKILYGDCRYELPNNYNEDDYTTFLNDIDFSYNHKIKYSISGMIQYCDNDGNFNGCRSLIVWRCNANCWEYYA